MDIVASQHSEQNALVETVFGDITALSKNEITDLIFKIQKEIEKHPQIEVPVQHYFSKDVYAREMTLPEGSLIVGKIHKFENLNILSKGEVSVLSIDGVTKLKAPATFVGSVGAKRLIYAHTDVVWTTIHGTPETNIDKIEEQFIAKSYDDIYLSSDKTLNDVLHLLGTTQEELTAISENESDLVPFADNYSVIIKQSPIHGLGLFATKDFKAGEEICTARISYNRTPAGRYSNHSGTPNAESKMLENSVYFYATADIKNGDEILTDYYFNYKNTRGNTLCLG